MTPAPSTGEAIAVSVVVPTFKRPGLLDRCLGALMAQEFAPAAYEIIVVDDGAESETRRLAGRWAERCRPAVRYLPMPRPAGPAAARNRGWRGATGEIVAFTDDDCLPAPGWLRAGVAAFDRCATGSGRERVAGAWGRTIVPLPPVPTDYERDAAGLERGEFVTANCFYRREALALAGGFDERFTAAWREDSDLFFALLARGARLVQAPAAVVTHPVRPAPWGISLRQQRKSQFNALLYKKHPALYRERIQPAPPWRYYRIVGAILATLALAARGHRRLLVLPLGVWLGLTARFCAQRLRGTSRAPGHVAEMAVTSVLIPPLTVFWRLRGAVKFRVFFL